MRSNLSSYISSMLDSLQSSRSTLVTPFTDRDEESAEPPVPGPAVEERAAPHHIRVKSFLSVGDIDIDTNDINKHDQVAFTRRNITGFDEEGSAQTSSPTILATELISLPAITGSETWLQYIGRITGMAKAPTVDSDQQLVGQVVLHRVCSSHQILSDKFNALDRQVQEQVAHTKVENHAKGYVHAVENQFIVPSRVLPFELISLDAARLTALMVTCLTLHARFGFLDGLDTLHGWTRTSAKSAIRQLVDLGVMTWEQAEQWACRPPARHPYMIAEQLGLFPVVIRACMFERNYGEEIDMLRPMFVSVWGGIRDGSSFDIPDLMTATPRNMQVLLFFLQKGFEQALTLNRVTVYQNSVELVRRLYVANRLSHQVLSSWVLSPIGLHVEGATQFANRVAQIMTAGSQAS